MFGFPTRMTVFNPTAAARCPVSSFYCNLDPSGVFAARQQWLQQGVSHLNVKGGLQIRPLAVSTLRP